MDEINERWMEYRREHFTPVYPHPSQIDAPDWGTIGE